MTIGISQAMDKLFENIFAVVREEFARARIAMAKEAAEPRWRQQLRPRRVAFKRHRGCRDEQFHLAAVAAAYLDEGKGTTSKLDLTLDEVPEAQLHLGAHPTEVPEVQVDHVTTRPSAQLRLDDVQGAHLQLVTDGIGKEQAVISDSTNDLDVMGPVAACVAPLPPTMRAGADTTEVAYDCVLREQLHLNAVPDAHNLDAAVLLICTNHNIAIPLFCTGKHAFNPVSAAPASMTSVAVGGNICVCTATNCSAKCLSHVVDAVRHGMVSVLPRDVVINPAGVVAWVSVIHGLFSNLSVGMPTMCLKIGLEEVAEVRESPCAGIDIHIFDSVSASAVGVLAVLMKCILRQPWPPPIQLRNMGASTKMRPIPWPSLCMSDCCDGYWEFCCSVKFSWQPHNIFSCLAAVLVCGFMSPVLLSKETSSQCLQIISVANQMYKVSKGFVFDPGITIWICSLLLLNVDANLSEYLLEIFIELLPSSSLGHVICSAYLLNFPQESSWYSWQTKTPIVQAFSHWAELNYNMIALQAYNGVRDDLQLKPTWVVWTITSWLSVCGDKKLYNSIGRYGQTTTARWYQDSSTCTAAKEIKPSPGMSTSCLMSCMVQIYMFEFMENIWRNTSWPQSLVNLINQKIFLAHCWSQKVQAVPILFLVICVWVSALSTLDSRKQQQRSLSLGSWKFRTISLAKTQMYCCISLICVDGTSTDHVCVVEAPACHGNGQAFWDGRFCYCSYSSTNETTNTDEQQFLVGANCVQGFSVYVCTGIQVTVKQLAIIFVTGIQEYLHRFSSAHVIMTIVKKGKTELGKNIIGVDASVQQVLIIDNMEPKKHYSPESEYWRPSAVLGPEDAMQEGNNNFKLLRCPLGGKPDLKEGGMSYTGPILLDGLGLRRNKLNVVANIKEGSSSRGGIEHQNGILKPSSTSDRSPPLSGFGLFPLIPHLLLFLLSSPCLSDLVLPLPATLPL